MTAALPLLALLAAAGPAARPAPVPAPASKASPGVDVPIPPPPRLPAGARGGALRVAVVDPQTSGEIPPRPLAAFAQALVPEIRKLDGVSAIGMAEIRDMLGFERQRQMLGCSSDEGCLAEIGGALGVDELVSIQLTLVGNSYALTGRRLDMKRARVVQTVSRQFDRRDGEELLSVVGPFVEGLWPDRPLKAGAARGLDKSAIARLNPPPLPRWVFITAASVAAGTLAAGAVAGILARESQNEFDDLARRSTSHPVAGADVRAAQQKARDRAALANTLYVSGAVLGVAAGVTAFFTDWHDDRGALKITPVVAQGGAGAVVAGRF